MKTHLYRRLLFCLFLAWAAYPYESHAQDQASRIAQLETRLNALSYELPGIHERVNIAVSGASIQEFLRAVAEASGININVASDLNIRIYNNFQSETTKNILLFIAKEYHLDMSFVGNIISVSALDPSSIPRMPKPVNIQFDNGTGLLQVDLSQDSLVVVARRLTDLTGTNVIVTNDIASRLVTLYAQDMDLSSVLRQLAFNNQLKVVATASGASVFMALGANEENYINADNELAVRRRNTIPNAMDDGMGGEASFYVDAGSRADANIPTISIEATNTPIEQIIKNAAAQVNANYFMFTGIQGTTTAKLSNVSFDDLLTTLLLGTNYTYKQEKGIYMIGDRRLEGLREVRVLKLQNRSIDTIQTMIPNEWKQGVEIREFREQNTILLSGASPQLNEIESLVRQLDTRVPMVLIEVTMLDIRKSHSVSTGITAGVADSMATGGRILSGVDFTVGAQTVNNLLSRIGTGGAFNLGRVVPNFYVQLSALEDNANVELRSVPKLSTLNGHTASLSIGNKRYYSISTQNVLGSLNPQTVVTEQFNDVEANMTIDIKPIVSGDEQVTLNIGIDISDFTQDTPLNQPPPTSTSKFVSIIRVRNEETVVLGGIERFEAVDNASGLPGIARIPVLKWFFSHRTKGRSKVVSIVFIKPTIIYQ